jgi:hypothetical protein
MYQKLRIPLFLASLVVLAASLALVVDDLVAEAHEQSPEELARERARDLEQAQAAQARVDAYTKRLRDDAFEHLAKGDDEIALARLDEATEMDGRSDRLPEVRAARKKIAEDLGLDDPDAAASDTPSPTARPGAAHE